MIAIIKNLEYTVITIYQITARLYPNPEVRIDLNTDLIKIRASPTKKTIIVISTLLVNPSIMSEERIKIEITSRLTTTNKVFPHFQIRAMETGK